LINRYSIFIDLSEMFPLRIPSRLEYVVTSCAVVNMCCSVIKGSEKSTTALSYL